MKTSKDIKKLIIVIIAADPIVIFITLNTFVIIKTIKKISDDIIANPSIVSLYACLTLLFGVRDRVIQQAIKQYIFTYTLLYFGITLASVPTCSGDQK